MKINIKYKTESILESSRYDPPSFVGYFGDGERVHVEVWEDESGQSGLKHRDNDLPANIVYSEDGTISSQTWFIHGNRQRANGNLPDYINYWYNGVPRQLVWHEPNNNNDPWKIETYDESGKNVVRETWNPSIDDWDKEYE